MRPIAYCALFHICAMYLGIRTELLNVPMRLCILYSRAWYAQNVLERSSAQFCSSSSRLIDVASKCARHSFESYAAWLSTYSRQRIDMLEGAARLNYRQVRKSIESFVVETSW